MLDRAFQTDSAWRRGVRTLLRSKSATAGAIIILILLFLLAFGPTLAPYDPTHQDLLNRHGPPSTEHWLGTDQLGRDILTRVFYGARISLSLSIGAVALALVLGVPIGLFSGYVGGWIDQIVVALVDILLTFPAYLLAILIVAIVGPSLTNIMLAVGFATLPALVRVVRGDTLGVKNWELIVATKSIGARTPRIVFRHILPNIMSSIAVVASLRLGSAILVEASLSFLGLGLSPPTPAWGLMINEGLRYLAINPWIAIAPGVAIMLTVLGFNLFGDGLRDALDPRLRGRSD
jgi:peptide/nickel transport system permease protein